MGGRVAGHSQDGADQGAHIAGRFTPVPRSAISRRASRRNAASIDSGVHGGRRLTLSERISVNTPPDPNTKT